MKEKIKNIARWFTTHKWQVGVGVSVLVLTIGCGAIGYAIHNKGKIDNTAKMIELAEGDGILTNEEIQNLENNDGVVLGEEVVDTKTGETVVLTQDENGNIQKTVVKDSQGNSTGAVVPQNYNTSGKISNFTPVSSDNANSGEDKKEESTHTHTWTAHYATREVTRQVQHEAVTKKEKYMIHDAYHKCLVKGCGQEATEEHVNETGHGRSMLVEAEYGYRDVVVSPAWTENVVTQENYIDYYYCSGCGEKQ